MILTGENRSTGRKTCPNATSSTTNLTWTDLALNAYLHVARPVNTLMSHVTACVYYHMNNIMSLFNKIESKRHGMMKTKKKKLSKK
jgi:hypothetical protein